MSRYTLLYKYIPRLMAVLLILTLLMPFTPAASAAAQSGSCGENLEWSFSGGTLTITGEGRMTDYSYHAYAPWYSFRDQIVRLELPEGLTRVGSMAFFDCMNLQTISLPSTVKSVGELAFCQCSAAVIVKLNEGLQSIERSAFELCSGVQDFRLPQSLTSIGRRAFYRCGSLQYVTVPASVTELGTSVFAYCEGLIRADIRAHLTELPRWTFFGCTSLTSISLEAETTALGDLALQGCENLTTVYYDGTEMDAETLKEEIMKDHESFDGDGEITTPENSGNSGSTVGTETDENGETIVADSTVTKTDESVITVIIAIDTANGGKLSDETRIDATIWEEAGWDQVQDTVEDATDRGPTDVTIYVPGDSKMPQDFLDSMAGKDVTVDVFTGSGAQYTLDFAGLGKGDGGKGLNLSYTLTRLDSPTYKNVMTDIAYSLRFQESSDVPVKLIIRLPVEHARQTASLYQIKNREAQKLQSVIVDDSGAAHFYVANVDDSVEYLVGLQVPEVSLDDTIVPDTLTKNYGITEQIRDVDYVITGRKSSWNLNFLEVNQILVGFMLSTAAFVGLLMYARNKRKLRQGFVPGWDDADDGE